METKLFEIRCPFKVRSRKNNHIYDCNQLCVKVASGSTGEAWCPKCKLAFDFDVDGTQSNRSIRVKKHE